jgi:hypothetical protein
MNDEPVDQTLRQMVGNPQPTDADRQHTRRILAAAIRSDTRPARPARHWFATPAFVASSLVVVLIAAITVQVLRPTPVQAALAEIAAAAQKADPLTIPDQQYAYRHTEAVNLVVVPDDAFEPGHRDTPLAYLLPTVREEWIGTDGTVQLRTTANTPTFFTPEDESDYLQAGLDQTDNIGQTITETFGNVTSILDDRTWPTDPDQLETALTAMTPAGSETPETVDIFNLALAFIRQPDTPPALRSAALGVIARLDLTLSEHTSDGTRTFTLTYTEPQPATITVTLDTNGQLLYESVGLTDGDAATGVPPNTTISANTYQPIQIVGNLDSP